MFEPRNLVCFLFGVVAVTCVIIAGHVPSGASHHSWLALPTSTCSYDASIDEGAHPAELGTLVTALTAAAEEFAEVVADREWWDCQPVPFHVVLQGTNADVFEPWRAAGAEIAPLAVGGLGD